MALVTDYCIRFSSEMLWYLIRLHMQNENQFYFFFLELVNIKQIIYEEKKEANEKKIWQRARPIAFFFARTVERKTNMIKNDGGEKERETDRDHVQVDKYANFIWFEFIISDITSFSFVQLLNVVLRFCSFFLHQLHILA